MDQVIFIPTGTNLMSRGRPRQFDSEKALHDAMVVFWRNGYRGTSVDDLTAALGINKPSLYAAFGDKEALFLQVVDHYREKMMVPAMRQFAESDNLRDGLAAMFAAIGEVVVENETPPGCMIACLLADECCETPSIKEKLAASIEGADKFFRKKFEAHRAELNPALTPEAAALLMVSTLHGVSIRARAGGSREVLASAARAFMAAVLASP